MDPTQKPNASAPDPSSILWAHQLRLDIVSLAGSVNILHGDHAKTIKILTDLGEAIDLLFARIRTLELQRDTDKLPLAQKDAKLMELTNSRNEDLAKFKDMFNELRATLEKTELVNQMLQGRIESLERSSSAHNELKFVRKENKNNRVASSGENRRSIVVFVVKWA
ncbi:hypothetical protein BJX63DRAFT_431043 [Aspergillus granulosus]|uniref:Uncharacterized protein n=1 Tax=Aspergillus granulosus TaxID=176169 RepID=A0ABR4HHH9_9EURO